MSCYPSYSCIIITYYLHLATYFTVNNIPIIKNKEETEANIGGIIGYLDNNGECQSSYNIGNITIKETNHITVGGIVGSALKGSLKNCYNKGTIDVEAQYGSIGGIVAYSGVMKEFKNIYNFGNINAKMDNTSFVRIAGIVASTNNTEIKNTYNIGKIKANVVTTNSSYCGGIVGYNISSKINNTYNIGDIVPNNVQQSGNIVGLNVNSDSEIRNSYYNNDNGMEAYGGNSGYIDNETVKYTTSMPNVLDIINEENAFKEDTNNINNGYPVLEWQ